MDMDMGMYLGKQLLHLNLSITCLLPYNGSSNISQLIDR